MKVTIRIIIRIKPRLQSPWTDAPPGLANLAAASSKAGQTDLTLRPRENPTASKRRWTSSKEQFPFLITRLYVSGRDSWGEGKGKEGGEGGGWEVRKGEEEIKKGGVERMGMGE